MTFKKNSSKGPIISEAFFQYNLIWSQTVSPVPGPSIVPTDNNPNWKDTSATNPTTNTITANKPTSSTCSQSKPYQSDNINEQLAKVLQLTC